MSPSVMFVFMLMPCKTSCKSAFEASAQFRRAVRILLRISLAPALVYVKHNIPVVLQSGARNNMRNRRCVRTLVLPVPAFACTHTFCNGFAAESCSTESMVFFVIYALALLIIF